MNIKKWGCYGCGYLSGTYCQFLKEELKEDSYCPEYMGAIDIGLTFPEYLGFLREEEKKGARYQCCQCWNSVEIETFGFYCPVCNEHLDYVDVVKVK